MATGISSAIVSVVADACPSRHRVAGRLRSGWAYPRRSSPRGSCIWERSVSAAIPNYTPGRTPDTGVPPCRRSERSVLVTSFAADESSSVSVPAVWDRYRTALTAVLAGVAYLFAAELGMTLTMRPQPISTLWPPNAILFGLLLLTPQRRWWVILLGAFPAHLLVELWSGIPLPMILCWFLSNASEALIGASVVLVLGGGPARFDTFRGVGIFLLAALTSVFISCSLDAGFVQLNGWGSTGYWHNWSVRFLSNLLAQLTFVPLIVTWGDAGLRGLRRLWGSRAIEAAVLAV